MLEEIRNYLELIEKEAIPQLSVNCVIIGFHKGTLQVVVNKIQVEEVTLILLPGGYIKQAEDLTETLKRIVKESTGLENILFRQFAVFGKASRSFGDHLSDTTGIPSNGYQPLQEWFSRRFISICYIALVDFHTIDLNPTEFFETAEWLPVDQAHRLSMDHADILADAGEFLRKELPYMPIASNLLPTRFTLPELQALMEAVLSRKIDRPNFRRKILGTDLLKKVGMDHSGKRRPADIYEFRQGKNTSLLDDFKYGF